MPEPTKGEILIYGAGISGMVAAVNLAREGYKVTVREKEAGLGGSKMSNPSIHTTPLDPAATSKYTGVDISPALQPASSIALYLHNFRIQIPGHMTFHVERSSRKQSIDYLLYEECQKAGVRFEFSHPLKKEDISSLPPNTIIACGLNESVYEALDIPCVRWTAWMARGEYSDPSRENYAWVWLDESITEYGYISFCNGIYYNLLFTAEEEISDEALERYREFMSGAESFEEENWNFIQGVVPAGTGQMPALEKEGLILCGTMSGCIDPLFGFGISGALVSGKVAALAVTDPVRARAEFERFTRNFSKVYSFKRQVWYPLRRRVSLFEEIAKILGPERMLALLVDGIRHGRKNSAIPGFSPVSCN